MTVEVKSEGTQILETPDSHREEPVNAIEDPVSVAEEEKKPENQESEAEETKSEEPTFKLEEKAAEEEEPKSEQVSVSAKSSPFKEESSFLSDLKEAERKALAELRSKLEEAIQEKKLLDGEIESDVSLWGVPLLPSKNSDATNVVLLKFLHARDFKVVESFEMLQNTLQWRKEEKIDSLADEIGFGGDYESACYMDGYDREGHPVCYNMTSVFRDEEVYKKAFGSEEGRKRFLRWRVQVMEKGIQKLDLRPGGVSNLLQVTDLKNSVGVSKKELRDTVNKSLQILQDNYPEFVSKNVSQTPLSSLYFAICLIL